VSEQERESEEQHGPRIRDKRRIDPDTYQLREPQETAAPAAEPSVPTVDPEVAELRAALAERTADLQRLQAEYINYKRRVDRDREVVRTSGIESVLKDFLSVLDDISSAREHGELSGGFKAVAEELERVSVKYGLESYGTKGDPFNPHIHEALLHAHAEGLDGPTCVEILQPGYRIKDKILRPARVAVAEPDPDQPPVQDAPPVQGVSADEAGGGDAGTGEDTQ
jgi:molecular chaperone GrpE